MRLRVKSALWLLAAWLLVLAVAGLAALGVWADLSADERSAMRALVEPRIALLLVLALLLPFALAALLRGFVAAYPGRALRIAEELRVIHGANPAHRIEPGGGTEMRRLAHEVNALAGAYAALRDDLQRRVAEANAGLEQERNRLAALMSELAQAVLVCNGEGRILLYNPGAGRLLDREGGETAARVGLGRSLYALIDRRPVEHALAAITRRLARHDDRPVARFVTTRHGALLRAQMAPVLEPSGALGGFVLVLEDITRSVERNSRLDFVLQQLTEGTRAALANIRAAAENIQQFPDMDAAQRQRFHTVIRDEAEALSARLDEVLARSADPLRTPWPLEDMLAGDLLDALQRNVESGLGLAARCEGADEPAWLSVDSYSLVRALTELTGRLARARGLSELVLELGSSGRFVRLALRWQGPPLEAGQLDEWEQQPFDVDALGRARSLKDLLDQHGGEIWCLADRAGGISRLCLQLPAAQPEAPQPTAPGRPVYYDFDLFRQARSPELDERSLAELSYTVFDTETTGLAPSEGDEIISIGAVRVVNGRLLRRECFDQLVDPRRPIHAESQKVHGISSAMLAGQPAIQQVLPSFHAFAEDTVLVAHNAAFDLRFLQLKEAATGVRFDQPVLDTLLLSALVHPGHGEEHRLEQIAARLGVAIVGRHSALGDAIVTGEVLLKLIPLLAEQGIHTLGQARAASQKTGYSRLAY